MHTGRCLRSLEGSARRPVLNVQVAVACQMWVLGTKLKSKLLIPEPSLQSLQFCFSPTYFILTLDDTFSKYRFPSASPITGTSHSGLQSDLQVVNRREGLGSQVEMRPGSHPDAD